MFCWQGSFNVPVIAGWWKGKYIQHQPLVHCSKASYIIFFMEFAVWGWWNSESPYQSSTAFWQPHLTPPGHYSLNETRKMSWFQNFWLYNKIFTYMWVNCSDVMSPRRAAHDRSRSGWTANVERNAGLHWWREMCLCDEEGVGRTNEQLMITIIIIIIININMINV